VAPRATRLRLQVQGRWRCGCERELLRASSLLHATLSLSWRQYSRLV
jgi:hypothetical protein